MSTPGDADGDDNADIFDWVKVRRIVLGLDTPTPGADAGCDNGVDTFDWVKVKKTIARLDWAGCP